MRSRRRDPTVHSLQFSVERDGEQPLTRHMREAQKIANKAPGRLINEKYEHILYPASSDFVGQ